MSGPRRRRNQVVGNNAVSLYCAMGPLFTCQTYYNSGWADDSIKLGGKRVNLASGATVIRVTPL
ncbi:hypothetical protein [Streptomyces sp. HC307]|uniref:hypothetical protein n=1 Tax=Streptomyces flavusporus TaxID=3385496 RepID=UPI0039172F91